MNRILIVQTAFIGDVILSLPLLQRTRRLFPDAQIEFLAIPAAANLLEIHPDINHLWIYDKRGKDRGLRALLTLSARLRARNYDLAIVPHRSLRSALLVWTAGIPNRIGFHRSSGRFLLTEIIPYPKDVHEINRNLHLLRRFGVDESERINPHIEISGEDEQVVADWLHAHQLTAGIRLIAMAPGSVWATKRWLPERFATVADTLHTMGYHTVLIGGSADHEVAGRVIENASNPPANAVGALTLRQSAALIRRCRMLITNDSAPLHLGVAMRIAVVAIFGPTVAEFGFYPYGEHDILIEQTGLKCRPCGAHGADICPISTFECMMSIDANRVIEVVAKRLSNNG